MLRRVAGVVALVALFLVPDIAAPARTILIPRTMARSVSSVAAAPISLAFPATHIAFTWSGPEGTGVRYRVRTDEVWSQWTAAPESHDMETGRKRFSGIITVDRASEVEYAPTGKRSVPKSRVTLHYLNTTDGPKTALRVPRVAQATAQVPTIVTRAEWGADESIRDRTGSCKPRFFDVQQLFVHHTAGSNFDPDPAATMRAIYWYHTAQRGWCDIGYNFVVSHDGVIFEGRWARNYRPWEVHSSENGRAQATAGAHVANYNSGSVGVSVMGNYSQVPISAEAYSSLAGILAWEADRHDLDPMAKHLFVSPVSGSSRWLPVIAGHRAAGSTECPGSNLKVKALRQEVATIVGAGKAETTLTLQTSTRQASPGETVTVSGTLFDDTGMAVPSAPVTLYEKPVGGEWVVASQTFTLPNGTYSFSISPTTTVKLRTWWTGRDSAWGDESPLRRIEVI